MQNGIVMGVFGQLAYLVQAVLALESVRQHSDVPVTLVTDQPDHPVLVTAGFDNIISHQPESIAAMPHDFAMPLLARVHALQLSPYECTLALDVDARIKQPGLDRLFGIGNKVDVAIAPCLLDTSRERAMYDKPLWNNGVILYRNHTRVRQMLARFEAVFREHLPIAATPQAVNECVEHIADADTRKRLLCSDQIALSQIFSPVINTFDLKYTQLPEHWNWRGGNANRICAEDIVIDHHPSIRNDTFNQLADYAFSLLSAGEVTKAALYYQVAITALDPSLLKSSAAEKLQQLIGCDPLRASATGLKGKRFDAQSASLLAVVLLHQRTLNEIPKAQAILQGLLNSNNNAS